MAAGITYGDQVILDDYPCDIRSIVRYRGGFNIIEPMDDCVFPPFTPVYVNLVTREVAQSKSPSWDTENDYIISAFSYNQSTFSTGETLTVILHANEISLTKLEALRYYISGKEATFTDYVGLTTDATARTKLFTKFSTFNFVW